jgi:hypothetical protein
MGLLDLKPVAENCSVVACMADPDISTFFDVAIAGINLCQLKSLHVALPLRFSEVVF